MTTFCCGTALHLMLQYDLMIKNKIFLLNGIIYAIKQEFLIHLKYLKTLMSINIERRMGFKSGVFK